jgi:hypothetical protein
LASTIEARMEVFLWRLLHKIELDHNIFIDTLFFPQCSAYANYAC